MKGSRALASATLFDDLAESYEGWFETDVGRYVDEREKKLIFAMVRPNATDSILEVGSGTGYYLEVLAALVARCVGVEPSAEMLAVALARSPRAGNYVRGTGEDLPFRDGVFDGLLFMTTLEFIPDPEAAIQEAARVVRPGGRIVLGVLNADGPWARARRREGGLWEVARFYRAAELSAMLASFGPVTLAYCVHVPPALAARLPTFCLGLVDWMFGRVVPGSGALIGARITLRSRE